MTRRATIIIEAKTAEAREAVADLSEDLREMDLDVERAEDSFKSMGAVSERTGSDVRDMGVASERTSADIRQMGPAAERAGRGMREYAESTQRAQSETATMRSSVSGSANNLGFEFVQAAQDARFGMAGVANQIPLMTEQFTQLQAKTGSTTGAFNALVRQLAGPVGIIGAITLGLPLLEDLTSRLFSTGEAAEKAGSEAATARQEFIGLFDAARQGIGNIEQFTTALQNLQQVDLELRTAEPGAEGLPVGFRISEGTQVATDAVAELQRALNRTTQFAETLRIALRALGEQEDIDVATIMTGDIEEARAEVSQFREEINRLLSEPQEVLRQEPQVFSRLLQERFQEIQARQQRLAQEGLRTQEEALDRQVSFLEDVLTQASDAFAQGPQQFTPALNRLSNTVLPRLRNRLQEIQQAQEKSSDEAEDTVTVFEEQENKIKDLRSTLEMLQTPEGNRLTRLRNQKEELERQVELARFLNRLEEGLVLPQAVRQQRARRVEPAARQRVRAGQVLADRQRDIQAAIGQRIRQARLAGSARELGRELRNAQQAASEAGSEVDQKINNQIARGINLASQLGATLVQAAEKGGLSFQQVFSSVLGTVGQVLGLAGQPIAGAILAGGGTLVSAFQHGGVAPGGPIRLHPPEILASPEQGTRIVGREETMQILAETGGGQTDAVVQKLDEVAQRVEQMEVRISAFDAGAEIGRAQGRLERAGDRIYPAKA